MAEQDGTRQPHFINSKLLDALGGTQETQTIHGSTYNLVNDGAYLWGVDDREKGKGILNHVLLASRVAYTLGRELKEAKVEEYQNLNLEHLVHGAILHDITKLYGEDREKLPGEVKEALNIPLDFREISGETDAVAESWLKKFGFTEDVYTAVIGHDFPLRRIENPYWKIILISDFMTGQEVMGVDDRLTDVKARWIEKKIAEGQTPRIEPERFKRSSAIIHDVAQEIFGYLRTTDTEFVKSHNLNDQTSQTRWESFLRRYNNDRASRAYHLVKLFIDGKRSEGREAKPSEEKG